MLLEKIEVGVMGVNCYVVGDKNEAIVIDPGASFEKISSYLDKKNIKVKYILLTHCHFDHILAANELKKYTNALIVMSEKENENIKNPSISMTDRFARNFEGLYADTVVSDGDVLKSGEYKFKIIETPGHTSGGICLYCEREKLLFSGDTLFYQSIGRCDFPTGNFDTLISSIKTKLLTLPGDTHVFPGHEAETTIENEINYNPYLR